LVDQISLHDIGKVTVPEHILLKPGRLTDDEMTEMKLHVPKGVAIIDAITAAFDLDVSDIGVARNIIAFHHENVDGSGYPAGVDDDLDCARATQNLLRQETIRLTETVIKGGGRSQRRRRNAGCFLPRPTPDLHVCLTSALPIARMTASTTSLGFIGFLRTSCRFANLDGNPNKWPLMMIVLARRSAAISAIAIPSPSGSRQSTITNAYCVLSR
jgi:hypothetical protein